MANPIVTVNVSRIQAPLPDTLQKTGALISQGGTTLSVGATAPLTQFSDLAPLLAAPLALTTLVWSAGNGGMVTVTASAPHGVAVGSEFVTEIADCLPAGYNGTYRAMATGTATFIYYLAVDPGSMTQAGTYLPPSATELTAMARTFFGQGQQVSVYVLELGAGAPSVGVANLQNFIDSDDVQFFYLYLTPRNWDADSSFLAFLINFEADTAKTYFYVTTTLQNRRFYDDTMKCLELMVESPAVGTWNANVLTAAAWSGGRITFGTTTAHGVKPGQYFTITGCTPSGYNGTWLALDGTTGTTLTCATPTTPGLNTVLGVLQASLYASSSPPATSFDHASDFWKLLSYSPSSTNRVSPYAFSYLFGVTTFPSRGNSALISSLKATSVNYVGTGAEGGITNQILLWGHFRDGRPVNYWYAIDWMQINAKLFLANTIINGSNDPRNPLYYKQDGINRLQRTLVTVGSSAITFGLALGKIVQTELNQVDFDAAMDKGEFAGNVVVNAVPFTDYLTANPNHYRIGRYDGLSIGFVPLRGFEQITVNIVATDFVTA